MTSPVPRDGESSVCGRRKQREYFVSFCHTSPDKEFCVCGMCNRRVEYTDVICHFCAHNAGAGEKRLDPAVTPAVDVTDATKSRASNERVTCLCFGSRVWRLRLASLCFCHFLGERQVLSPVHATRLMLRLSLDRKSTRLNSSHSGESRMPSSA